MSYPIFVNDPQWAIAGKLPVAALERERATLPRELQGEGSKVVEGDGGWIALFVFGGPASEGESIAKRLAREVKTPVYLLDLDDRASSIVEHSGTRTTHRRKHPFTLLEEHGIERPGQLPIESSIVSVGLLEGATPKQARKAIPDVDGTLVEHPRGTLVTDGPGGATLVLAHELKCRAYIVSVDRDDRSFDCQVIAPDGRSTLFSPVPSPNYTPIEAVLGETTLDGIMRALGIPRELLPPS